MKRILLVLVAVSVLWAGTPVDAALVQRSATLSLGIEIVDLASFVVSGTAIVSVDTVTGAFAVPAAGVSLGSTLNFPVTTTTSIVSVIANPGIGNRAGTFSLGNATANSPGEICPGGGVKPEACILGGGVNGPMGLTGVVSVKFGAGFTLPIWLGLTDLTVSTLIQRSAMVGLGDSSIVPPSSGGNRYENGVWTTGPARISFVSSGTFTVFAIGQTVMTTPMVDRTITSTGTNSGSLTSGSAQITLVTPTYVSSLGNPLPFFASFTIQVVPEPETLLLLGSGIAGLALCVRSRARKR